MFDKLLWRKGTKKQFYRYTSILIAINTDMLLKENNQMREKSSKYIIIFKAFKHRKHCTTEL